MFCWIMDELLCVLPILHLLEHLFHRTGTDIYLRLRIFPGPASRRNHKRMASPRTASSSGQGFRRRQPPLGDHCPGRLTHHPRPCSPCMQTMARPRLRHQVLKLFPQSPPTAPPRLLHHTGIGFVRGARCSTLCPRAASAPRARRRHASLRELQLRYQGYLGLPEWQPLHPSRGGNKMDTWSAPPAMR
jgi:hypothetical protein